MLTARSGLGTAEQSIDRLAQVAATQQARTGRAWRNLQDTTNDPAMGSSRSKPWIDQLRGMDYYTEGMLLWLDVDTTIRAASGGKRSLDDVARALLGGATVHHADGSPAPQTYTFADLVQVLSRVQPMDWAAFLRTRLDGTEPVLGGLAGSGWKLDWASEESRFAKAAEGRRGDRQAEHAFDLGLVLSREEAAGRIEAVSWGSPAFRAGLAPEQTVVAVNRRAYSPEVLNDALQASQKSRKPLSLLVREGDTFRDVVIDYQDGPRYPRLARVPGAPDRLADILRARPD